MYYISKSLIYFVYKRCICICRCICAYIDINYNFFDIFSNSMCEFGFFFKLMNVLKKNKNVTYSCVMKIISFLKILNEF